MDPGHRAGGVGRDPHGADVQMSEQILGIPDLHIDLLRKAAGESVVSLFSSFFLTGLLRVRFWCDYMSAARWNLQWKQNRT